MNRHGGKAEVEGFTACHGSEVGQAKVQPSDVLQSCIPDLCPEVAQGKAAFGCPPSASLVQPAFVTTTIAKRFASGASKEAKSPVGR